MRQRRHPLTRRDFLKTGLAASAAIGFAGAGGFASPIRTGRRTAKKMIILGMDGLDHHLFKGWLEAGKLPAFRRILEAGGDFRPLRSSIPPQSPVAWSNFITGMDPGGHAIFDFIHRDPATYLPAFSASETIPGRRSLKLGKTVIPLSGGEVRNLRRGRAFWQILEDHGVPSTIFKIPSNYPPVKSRQRTLSGMGTPDLKGYYGLFNYYTNEYKELTQEAGGGGRVHEVYVIGNRVEGKIPGPENPFKAEAPETTIDFQVFIDPVNPVAKISIQGQEFVLREKEWSGWKRIRFPFIPTQSASGICLFYLKEVRPKFKLYVSPINIDPADPALPLSTPDSYARELEEKFGPYFTKGLPADTSALDNDVLDEAEFLAQDDMVLRESRDMLEYELSRFDEGLFFFYFSSTDQRQHMFWRLLDRNHPAHDPDLASKFGGVIEEIYVEMDRVVAGILDRIDDETVFLVMSDHGFNSFSRGFNLNTWLAESGYHKLVRPWKMEDSVFFDNTDWTKTQAYGIGLNSLYLNQKGREREGIVSAGAEADNLLREIARKLEDVVDPSTGEKIIRSAYLAKEVYHGPGIEVAPDIVLGFNRGYRISWQSPLGGFPKALFEDNVQKWSGDHMTSPDVIPGVVLANRKIRMDGPALADLTATILDVFGVEKGGEIIGGTIF
jgi:predicted AlkP superfamily phosphohydrolase/phosphomutase